MPKLVTWMNNQRVGELTKLANGAHTFKYAPEWLASRYARPLSLSLPLQRRNITSDAVRLDSPLVYVGAHNVYYVKLPVKVLYFTIHIHTQINQYVVISDFPPVSVEKFNLCSVMAHHRP